MFSIDFAKNSLGNEQEMFLLVQSHRFALKMQKNPKKYKQLTKTQSIGALKIISLFLNANLFSMIGHLNSKFNFKD